jgi:tRNA(adenine34) deaminase
MTRHHRCAILVIKLCCQHSLSYITRTLSSHRRCGHDKCPENKYEQLSLHASYSDGCSSMSDLTPASHQNIEAIHFTDEYDDEMMRNYFMDLALQQAKIARERGEVPIGAVIVGCFDDNTISTNGYTTQSQISTTDNQTTFWILSRAHNLVETNMDASAHAELLALRTGARNLRNWRFPPNSTIYTTLEPCPMCLSSIQAFRIDNIVYGAPDHRLGAVKSHVELLSIVRHPYHEIKTVVGGVLEDRCGDMMIDFFRDRRKIAKVRKKKNDLMSPK